MSHGPIGLDASATQSPQAVWWPPGQRGHSWRGPGAFGGMYSISFFIHPWAPGAIYYNLLLNTSLSLVMIADSMLCLGKMQN